MTINIANKGGVAFDTTVTVTTNGLSKLTAQAIWGLGAGCSVSGTTVSCDLVSLPTGGAIPVAVISGTVASLPVSAVAAMTTVPADSDPSDNAATWSVQQTQPSPGAGHADPDREARDEASAEACGGEDGKPDDRARARPRGRLRPEQTPSERPRAQAW